MGRAWIHEEKSFPHRGGRIPIRNGLHSVMQTRRRRVVVIVVVEYYCFLKIIIVAPPEGWPSHGASTRSTCLSKTATAPRRDDGASIWPRLLSLAGGCFLYRKKYDLLHTGASRLDGVHCFFANHGPAISKWSFCWQQIKIFQDGPMTISRSLKMELFQIATLT